MPRGVNPYDQAFIEERLWDPTMIQSGTTVPALGMWLDASDPGSVALSSGLVTQWNDKSGNGNNLTQSDNTLRPTYTYQGLNGRNVLTFNADMMRSADGVLNRPGLMVYVVGSSQNVSCTFFGWPQHPTLHTAPFFRFSLFKGSGSQHVVRIDGVESLTGGATFDTGVNITSVDSFTAQTIKNGSIILTQTPATITYPNSVPFVLGGTAASTELTTGVIAEVIVLTYYPSLADRIKIEGYLAWKWGLRQLLVGTHPYLNRPPLISE